MSVTAASAADPHVFSVSELNRVVRDLLESGLGAVWIEGELSNLARPSSGHLYFSLKDRDAQVRCAMFRNRNRLLDFTPQAGDQVRLRARVSVYEARGDYQLIAEQMEPAGAGALAQAIEALKKRLAAQGLFDTAHKRSLPAFPRRLGVITSATGAALRDVLHVLQRRLPSLPVIVYPVPVQGAAASAAITAMLAKAGERGDCDVLLLVRGGGSLEDLQPFNEEAVARAIVACPLPVVTGVGHEVDITIADFAADQRAPTPSAAAAAATPDASELQRRLDQLEARLSRAEQRRLGAALERYASLTGRLRRRHPQRRLQQLEQRRDELTLRLLRTGREATRRRRERLAAATTRLYRHSPQVRIERERARLDRQRQRLATALRVCLASADQRLASAVRALHATSPLATLGRGYALVRRQADGRPVTTASAVDVGEQLTVQLAAGKLEVRVEAAHNDSDSG